MNSGMRREVRAGFMVLSLALGAVAGCAGRPPAGALRSGESVPHLRATAHDGTTVDLGDLGGRPTLVYFYPKDGTPGCTKEACAFRDVWDRYEEAGVRVVGVSGDDLESHRKFAAKHELPFVLVSDEDLTWAKAFGVNTTLGMHARDSFLVAPDGTVAKVYRGVDPGVHADEVLRDAATL
jgi:thioredoxin-dependent peroxiredoxin